MIGGWLDRFGGLVSVACAVHCVAVAVVPALLSGLGFGFVASSAFEWGFVVVAAVVASVAGVYSLRHHRLLSLGFLAGIALLLASRFAEQAGIDAFGLALALLGGATLVTTHVSSLRLARTCPAN